MKLPKRVENHIIETASYKIFSNNIPHNWIIREVSERDYGIDCYIELVNKHNSVTGELISIQLKGTRTIKWTKNDYYTFTGINISTTNYWNNFPTPVFICLVDIEHEKVYFVSVKENIRKNFRRHVQQKTFAYRIEKKSLLDKSNLWNFLMTYFKEKNFDKLEQNIITYFSHYNQYMEFIDENCGRDCFMGIEGSRFLYVKHFYNNLKALCDYFSIEWTIPSFSDVIKKSQAIYGDTYQLYEEQLEELLLELKNFLKPVSLMIKQEITTKEQEYWLLKNNFLYNVIYNIKNDGSLQLEYC